MRLRPALAVLFIVTMWFPAQALGASVRHELRGADERVVFDAAPGEANALTIESQPVSLPADGVRVVFRDAGAATLDVGPGCQAGPARVATCTFTEEGLSDYVVVRTGDGNDRVNAAAANDAFIELEGGPGADTLVAPARTAMVAKLIGDARAARGSTTGGNDTLIGGAGINVFDAGPGADLVDGGGDDDQITYTNEVRSVRLDLGRGRARTASGTDVLRSVETVEGGQGDDTLIGTARPDIIFGNAGRDRIEGRDGDDHLHGLTGYERTGRFGREDDVIHGGNGGDSITGSYGADRLFGGRGADSIRGGAGRLDVLSGGPGNDRLNAADGHAGERLNCGAGRDRARLNRGDRARRCERLSFSARRSRRG